MRLRALAIAVVAIASLLGVSVPAAHAATGVVTGRLVDPSGVPVAGGHVCVTAPMSFGCSMVTAADGVFSLAVEEGSTTLRASWSTFGGTPFVTTTFPVTVTPDGVDAGDVVVNRYATITGIVRDPNGAAVANALVNLCGSCTPVWTDATGRYTLLNVAPGNVTVTAFTQGLPTPPWYPASATIAVASGQAVTQDLTLVRGAVVSGVITNPDGSAVPAGIAVVWGFTSATTPPVGSNTVYTDASGRYTTPGLPAGTVVIQAGPSATGTRVASSPTAIALSESRTIDLQLVAGGWVVGSVTGPDGVAVANANLTLTSSGLGGTTARTAPDGTFRLPAVVAGTYTLSVNPPFGSPYAPTTRTVVVTSGAGTIVDLVLGFPGTITGTLVGPNGPVPSRVVSACAVPAMTPCSAASTGTTGTFTISRLGAGTYALQLLPAPTDQPPFVGASVSPVVVVAGGTTVQDLQFGVNVTPANAGGAVAAGGTIATLGSATPTNPVVTSVRSPIATSVGITEGVPVSMADVTVLGQAVELHTGAPATADDPFTVSFTVDASAFGSVDPLSADLRRNGDVVAACADPSGTTATPDPCVASRTLNGEGDLVVVARTSAFSVWAVTAPVAPAVQPFPVTGFFSPIRAGAEVNAAKAGRTVPVKFALGGDRGLDVLADGSPSSRAVPCTAGDAVAVPDQSAEPSALRYDADAGQYVYLWRTSSTWTGCRELTVRFVTGQELTAVFRFS